MLSSYYEKMGIKEILGKRIKALRIKNNLTQAELAEKVNIASKHQSCIETGKNFPSAELIEKYADVFNIDACEFFSISPFKIQESRQDIIREINQQFNRATDYELFLIKKIVKDIIE